MQLQPARLSLLQSSWSAAQHTGLVELLAFSPSSSPLQLASVSRDLLVLWRLEGAFPLSPGEPGRGIWRGFYGCLSLQVTVLRASRWLWLLCGAVGVWKVSASTLLPCIWLCVLAVMCLSSVPRSALSSLSFTHNLSSPLIFTPIISFANVVYYAPDFLCHCPLSPLSLLLFGKERNSGEDTERSFVTHHPRHLSPSPLTHTHHYLPRPHLQGTQQRLSLTSSKSRGLLGIEFFMQMQTNANYYVHQVWDVAEGCVVYQSPVMSGKPLVTKP